MMMSVHMPIALLALSALPLLAYMAGIIVITRALYRNLSANANDTAELPSCLVTVVVAARNEAGNVLRLLDDLLHQEPVPGGFEVILSDDFSDDETCSLARSFSERHTGFPLSILTPCEGDRPGKKAAIERALSIARGGVILSTDADTLHLSGWIRAMTAPFSTDRVHMVLGPVVYAPVFGFFGTIQYLEFLGIMGTTAGAVYAGRPLMCNAASLAWRSHLTSEAEGTLMDFRYASGDDQFLLMHVVKKYGPEAVTFCNSPRALVTTDPQPDLKSFFSQRLRWVSKSRGYRDPMVVITGLITWLVPTAILVGLITLPAMWPWIASFWLMKCLADYPLTRRMAHFTGGQRSLWAYFPAQLFQLMYVPFTGIAGLVLPYRWKGRSGLR